MDLAEKLKIVSYDMSVSQYVRRALLLALLYSLFSTLAITILIILANLNIETSMLLIIVLLIYLLNLLMWYLINLKEVDVKIEVYKKNIEYELGFLLKHMVVLLRAGVPSYNIFLLTSKGYGKASEVMERLAKQIASGIPASKALRDEAAQTPSSYMKFVLLQIASAIDSGADLAKILEELEKQITNEKMNEYRRYGFRLNPLMLMYMLLAIIIPTLSLPLILIILSFTGRAADFNVVHLVLILLIVMLIQYLFYRFITQSKPRYSLFE